MQKFTIEEREELREFVLAMMRSDERVTGGAVVGSGSTGTEDEWSDLDLTFGILGDVNPRMVLEEWTVRLQERFGIITHFDVPRGSAIYRVILFPNGLELDLSVVPEAEYGAVSKTFKLLFGKSIERSDFPKESTEGLIGFGWHHILHANSAIERGRSWQAVFWLNGLRDHILALKCIRNGEVAAHARGVHRLPSSDVEGLAKTLVQSLESNELRRSLHVLADSYFEELRNHNRDFADGLQPVIQHMIKIVSLERSHQL